MYNLQSGKKISLIETLFPKQARLKREGKCPTCETEITPVEVVRMERKVFALFHETGMCTKCVKEIESEQA